MHRRSILRSVLAAGVAAGAASAVAPGAAAAGARSRERVRLFHRDWGSGPPVLFAASWALDSRMWAYQVTQLSDRGFRCIAYDRRGHGRSPLVPAGYDMDVLADDMADLIAQLDLREVTLVGHSMGCAEILRYLARHGSGRVRRVALLAPAAPYLVRTADNPFGAPMAYHEATMRRWAEDFPGWAQENKAPFFTPQTSPALADWLTQQLVETPPWVAIATFRALLEADLRPGLSRIDRPTLVLQGDRDASAPLEFTGRRIAAAVPGAELKVYPGAPHGLFVTHMDAVNADLERFLRT
jgi:pimeloyl-ACP methyl ester carboxylesterase